MKKDVGKKASQPSQDGQEQKVGPLTQLLIKSRARIMDPKKWTRGAYARNSRGGAVNVMDPTAICWCAVGTLERECGRSTPCWAGTQSKTMPALDSLYQKAHLLLEQAGGNSITAVNDGAGHARVIQMYNQAIKMAKGE